MIKDINKVVSDKLIIELSLLGKQLCSKTWTKLYRQFHNNIETQLGIQLWSSLEDELDNELYDQFLLQLKKR